MSAIRTTMLVFATLLVAFSAAAADFDYLVPAAISGAGAHGSRWRTELHAYNVAASNVTIDITFVRDTSEHVEAVRVLPARTSVVFANAIKDIFGIDEGIGSLMIRVRDGRAPDLALTSRTINVDVFATEIPAIKPASMIREGEMAVLVLPTAIEFERVNIGFFFDEYAVIEYELIRNGGVRDSCFLGADPNGVGDFVENLFLQRAARGFFNVPARAGDVVYLRVVKGRAFSYLASVNELSGDFFFSPAVRVANRPHDPTNFD